MRNSFYLLSLLCCIYFGCEKPSGTDENLPITVETTSLEESTVIGVAEQYKLGLAIRTDNSVVWIDELMEWPDGYEGNLVKATGVIVERYDLPVFVADTPEERSMLQGIPVPSGTNLKEASRRLVMIKPKYKLSSIEPNQD